MNYITQGEIDNKSSCSRSHLISQTSNLFSLNSSQGFPGGSAVKNPPAIRRPRFDPWVKKIPWRRKWQPTPVFLPRKSHKGAWWATVHVVTRVRPDLVTKPAPPPHQFLTMQEQVNLVSIPLPSQHTCKNCPLYSYQQSPFGPSILKFPTPHLCSCNPASLNLTYA